MEVDFFQGQFLNDFLSFLLFDDCWLCHADCADIGEVEGGFSPVEGEGWLVSFEKGGGGCVETFLDGLDHAVNVEG